METITNALTINALFSGISGFLMILFRKKIATLFKVDSGRVFVILGISLIIFSLMIFTEIRNLRPPFALLTILLDLIWFLGSMVIVIWRRLKFSRPGYYSVAVIGFIVLLMAINQSIALFKLDNDTKGFKILRFSRKVKASKAKVWEVIADVGNFQKISTKLTDVKIVSGSGKGMVRSCSHGKEQWTETCSLWVPQQEYTFVVNTNAPDYPHPLKYMSGNFRVEGSKDTTSSNIIITFQFAYKNKFENLIFHPFVKTLISKDCEKILDNFQAVVEK